MRLQHQTHLSNKELGIRGNCLITTYACYLDLDVDECPQLQLLFDVKQPEYFWQDVVNLWLSRMGYEEYHSESDPFNDGFNDYYFAWGLSERGVNHQVIYKDGKLFHDPHPSNTGLKEVKGFVTLEKIKQQ